MRLMTAPDLADNRDDLTVQVQPHKNVSAGPEQGI